MSDIKRLAERLRNFAVVHGAEKEQGFDIEAAVRTLIEAKREESPDLASANDEEIARIILRRWTEPVLVGEA